MEKITTFLTENSDLIESITNIFTVIGIFLALYTYRYQKRKDRENNRPIIEFPPQTFFIKLIEEKSKTKSESYLTPAFFNEKYNQVFSLDTMGRNVGLNALQIETIKILNIVGFKRLSKYQDPIDHVLNLQEKDVAVTLFGKNYTFWQNHKINGNQITGFVHKEDYFTIEYHPFLLHYIAYNLLQSYHNRGFLEVDTMKFTELYKKYPLFKFKIEYKDVNGETHKKKVQVIGQIEPKEDFYVVQIGYVVK